MHPETPAGGLPLDKLAGRMDLETMQDYLGRTGALYNIEFGPMEVLSNSRLALEAGEFARDNGKYEEMHTRLFRSYFSEGKDIGRIETILEEAGKIGLNVESLKKSLDEGVYSARLQRSRELGAGYGITGLPTFIFNGQRKIVGAREYAAFVGVMEEILRRQL